MKPSSAPHSSGASSPSLQAIDPDYDAFSHKAQLSHSSSEVLTRSTPFITSPAPTPPASARQRDRVNNTGTSGKSSKGHVSSSSSSSAASSNRDSEVLKYSEFLPKLVQERQRLETELKLLRGQHRSIKKRRRHLQRLTKERVLKIQQEQQQQQQQQQQAAAATHEQERQHDEAAEPVTPKSSKRQVKIRSPRENHGGGGVFAMLGRSTGVLTTKDRGEKNVSSGQKKERRNTTTTTAPPTLVTSGSTTASSSSSSSTVSSGLMMSMAAGIARNTAVATTSPVSPNSRYRASSGALATKARATLIPGGGGGGATGGAVEDDGEGHRFFGSSKYRKYEMSVMKDDGFADLFSKFQASSISDGAGEDDEENGEGLDTPVDETSGCAAGGGGDSGSGSEGGSLTASSEGLLGDDSKPTTADSSSTAPTTTTPTSPGDAASSPAPAADADTTAASLAPGEGQKTTQDDELESSGERAAVVETPKKQADSLLGSFIEMKRDYLKLLNEFEEKKKDISIETSEKIAELQAILKMLRKEQAALKARVQTSQDDAQLLESFSVGVSLFDKKKEDEDKFGDARARRKSRENLKDVDCDSGNSSSSSNNKKTKKKHKKDDDDDDEEEEDEDEDHETRTVCGGSSATAEYGAADEVSAYVATVTTTTTAAAAKSSATAEYGESDEVSAFVAAASSSSSSCVTVSGACSSSATAEYGESSTFTSLASSAGGSSATAEYGESSAAFTSRSATAEYGESGAVGEAAADDADWEGNKKKARKRSGSRKKTAAAAAEEADGNNNNNLNNSGETETAATATAAAGTAKAARRKKQRRKSARASGREVLLKAYHEIAYEELQFDPKPLGNGAFGVVYKALWRGTAVAVKKLMVMQLTEAEVYNFKREASIMEKYSNHPNIVKFCGISSQFPHYCIVTEYMERGCVRDALAENPDLPWKIIVGMALDAAAGILHLHAEHIVHRDLALRNMLVGRDWRVRMADFGLARMMPKDTYAKTRGNIGAVRWLAPEVISKSVYSEKSDSYAFGIVMWELLTKGEEPFADMTNIMDVALGIINNDLRPKIPKDTPAEYQQLMVDCWAKNADDRPDFVQIHRRLKAYHATLA